MPNKRDIKLDAYGISQNGYRELLYHCKQYREMQKQLTGTSAAAAAARGKLEAIETAAAETDPVIGPYILKGIVEDIQYFCMPVPCSKQKYYRLRREIFARLAEKRGFFVKWPDDGGGEG